MTIEKDGIRIRCKIIQSDIEGESMQIITYNNLEKPANSDCPIKPRGGYRPGSGRKKAENPEKNRVRLSTTISPETEAFLKHAGKQPWLNQGRVVDLLLSLAKESPRFRHVFNSNP